MFCVTFGISWQHLNHPNLLVCAVHRFHVYFHVRLTLHELRISLPHKDGISNVKNDFERSAYYGVCDQYGLNPDETLIHGEWFYTTDYGIFGHEVKATERFSPDNLTRWITLKSKGFTTKVVEKISRSVMAYVYLALSSQVQARSTKVGNSAAALDSQQLVKDTFKSLINEDLPTDIEKYKGLLEHALSKVDFSVGIGIYMFPGGLNLATTKKEGHNNKMLVSNTGMKVFSNKDINRDHKKLIPPDVSNAVIPAAELDPVGTTVPHNLKMLTEKRNYEKLAITFLIVGARLIAYHLW